MFSVFVKTRATGKPFNWLPIFQSKELGYMHKCLHIEDGATLVRMAFVNAFFYIHVTALLSFFQFDSVFFSRCTEVTKEGFEV